MRRLVALAFVGVSAVLGAEPSEPAAPLASGVLHDNGPFVNSPGTGAGGADESVLQSGLGLQLFGFRNPVGEYALADNFIVPEPNGWWIDSATVFGYEVGSSLDSTFTTVIVRIWNGLPGAPGSLIIHGANRRTVSATRPGPERIASSTRCRAKRIGRSWPIPSGSGSF